MKRMTKGVRNNTCVIIYHRVINGEHKYFKEEYSDLRKGWRRFQSILDKVLSNARRWGWEWTDEEKWNYLKAYSLEGDQREGEIEVWYHEFPYYLE
jgi:hypothetical protein